MNIIEIYLKIKINKRRNRLEREARSSTKNDSAEKNEIIEETKDQQPTPFVSNKQNLLQMLNKGRALLESKQKSGEDSNTAQEGKVNAEQVEEVKESIEIVQKVEPIPQEIEEDKTPDPIVDERKESEDTSPEQSNKSIKNKTNQKSKQLENNQVTSKPENKKKGGDKK